MANWYDQAPAAPQAAPQPQKQVNWWDAAPAQQQVASPQAPAIDPELAFDPMRDLPVPGTPNRTVPQPRTFQSPIPGGDAINAFGNAFAENIPIVGPLLNQAVDATGSNLAAMITGRPQEELLAEGQGIAQDARDANPIATTAGAVAGSVGPLMALGTTQLGGQALGLTGPMAQRMAFGGVSGLGIAAGDALARGESVGDAAQQGALGLGIGTTMPLAERAISPIARMLMGQNVPAPVQSISRNLERARIDPATVPKQLDALGPDAALLDLNPNLTRQAGAIASLPGEGQTVLRDAMSARHTGTNARIQGDVDATLGPATSPRMFSEGVDQAQRALSPLYENAFEGARAVDTSPIALNLDSAAVNLRGEAQGVARSLRDMLNITGVDDALDPNPRTLFEVRKAIDGMFSTVQDGNARRLLSETRKLVDDELALKVPGIKDADAKFKQLAESRGAFEQGQTALDSGRTALTPADLAAVTTGAPTHVLDAMTQGTRAEIDRIIGTTGNNLTALKSALKGDGSWNRDRLATLFGKEKADKLLGVLEREQKYAASFDTVMRNSETAARTAAQKEAAPHQFGQIGGIADLLLKVPQGLANAGARTRSEATNKAIAEMLTGRPSPELIDRLLAARQMNRGLIGSSATPLLTN